MFVASASIGPRLGGRGDTRAGVGKQEIQTSFNWAAARRGRGDSARIQEVTQKHPLQLGRGSEAAETYFFFRAIPNP